MARVWLFCAIVAIIFASNSHLIAAAPECGHGPPVYINPERCCNFPVLEGDELFDQCIEVLNLKPTSDEEQDDLYEDSCVIECVFNNTGVYDLNEPTLVKQIMEGTKDIPEWFTRSKEYVQECLAEITPENRKVFEKFIMAELKTIGALDRKICDVQYMIFADCLYLKLFQECPKQRFRPSKKCNQLLNYVQHCDDWY